MDIKFAPRTEAMVRANVNGRHKGQSNNWIIALPVGTAMSVRDVELAALARVEERLERNIVLVRLATSERQEMPRSPTADTNHGASAPVFV